MAPRANGTTARAGASPTSSFATRIAASPSSSSRTAPAVRRGIRPTRWRTWSKAGNDPFAVSMPREPVVYTLRDFDVVVDNQRDDISTDVVLQRLDNALELI